MEVGRYYLTRGDYIGAINRFRSVVEQYRRRLRSPKRSSA